jgi:hypothetical protein
VENKQPYKGADWILDTTCKPGIVQMEVKEVDINAEIGDMKNIDPDTMSVEEVINKFKQFSAKIPDFDLLNDEQQAEVQGILETVNETIDKNVKAKEEKVEKTLEDEKATPERLLKDVEENNEATNAKDALENAEDNTKNEKEKKGDWKDKLKAFGAVLLAVIIGNSVWSHTNCKVCAGPASSKKQTTYNEKAAHKACQQLLTKYDKNQITHSVTVVPPNPDFVPTQQEIKTLIHNLMSNCGTTSKDNNAICRLFPTSGKTNAPNLTQVKNRRKTTVPETFWTQNKNFKKYKKKDMTVQELLHEMVDVLKQPIYCCNIRTNGIIWNKGTDKTWCKDKCKKNHCSVRMYGKDATTCYSAGKDPFACNIPLVGSLIPGCSNNIWPNLKNIFGNIIGTIVTFVIYILIAIICWKLIQGLRWLVRKSSRFRSRSDSAKISPQQQTSPTSTRVPQQTSPTSTVPPPNAVPQQTSPTSTGPPPNAVPQQNAANPGPISGGRAEWRSTSSQYSDRSLSELRKLKEVFETTLQSVRASTGAIL